jgi:hypothetical protein
MDASTTHPYTCPQVINASGAVKNTQYIAGTLKDFAAELVGDSGSPNERVLGVCMDNTKANLAACRLLEQEYPCWVALGCQAHGLDLSLKDLSKEKHNTWTAGVISLALKASLVIGGSEHVRSALHKQQRELYGKVRLRAPS